MPKVSIILTSYNHEKYISCAIESALTQTFTDFELIIADDCSTDNSWEIICSYNDSRIVPVRFEQNMRMPIPMSLKYAKGRYVAIHHSDDVWEPDKLQKQVEYMDSHLETAACFTHVRFISESGDDYTPPEGSFYHNRFDQTNRSRFEWLRFFWEEGNALCHPSMLIRKEIYEKCTLTVLGLVQMPDFFRWIRICLTDEIHVFPEQLTKFRLRMREQTNTSADRIDTQIRSAAEYFFIFDELFKISDRDIFFNVFPEYASQNVVAEFVLSRRLLEKGFPSAQFYGLNKLYGLINNPQTASNIKNLHNYTYINFIEDTGGHDIFGTKCNHTFLDMSVYVDYGNGYNDTDRITQSVYVEETGFFYAEFILPENKDIIGLRVDPDEQRLWDISLDSVIIDGVAQNIKSSNAFFKTNEYDSFLTYDPIYIISCPSLCKVMEIRGRVRPVSVNTFKAINAGNVILKNIIKFIGNSRFLRFLSRFFKSSKIYK